VTSSSFHESYVKEAVEAPSERSTGIVFTVVALLVGLLWRHNEWVLLAALGTAVVLAATSLIAPRLLRPLNLAWFRLSLALNRVVSPIVMFVIFAAVFVPGGILMRIWRDPLRARRAEGRASYWIEPAPEEQASSMKSQF